MPESAGTQILWTKVVDDGPDTVRVELAIADKPNLEDATESIVISVRVGQRGELASLVRYQWDALEHAVGLIREHSLPMKNLLES